MSGYVRSEFGGHELRRAHLREDPLEQFQVWLSEAIELPEDDPFAMTLSTVASDGLPGARIVSLKRVDDQGLVFTTSTSQKTSELEHQPVAALVFYWPRLQRQVRLRGMASRLGADADLDLFESRNRDQRLALHGFAQGVPVPSRAAVTERHAQLDLETGEPVPLPEGWGGWRVVPTEMEFWQARERRLHDRFRYAKDGSGGWALTRLAP